MSMIMSKFEIRPGLVVDNLRLCFTQEKGATTRGWPSRYLVGHTYPLVPRMFAKSFARVTIDAVTPKRLSEFTQEDVDREGYKKWELTLGEFVTGFRQFKKLEPGADPTFAYIEFEMLPFSKWLAALAEPYSPVCQESLEPWLGSQGCEEGL